MLLFVCQHVHLRVDNDQTPFTESLHSGQILRIPIAHNEGNFFLPEDELSNLEKQGQIVLRYCDTEGNITSQANPNGSVGNIAGIKNQQGNVMGLMPHPERATFLKQIPTWLDNEWGLRKSVMKEEGVSASGPWTPFFMGLKKYLMSQHACVEESRG